MKLDLKGRKLLYELDIDSRQSCSKIGKKIGLSTEVVNYRIKKLEKENIITQYQLVVNLSTLNVYQFKICLSFQHMKSDKLEEIINTLKQNNFVKWLVSSNGNWDLIISLEIDSIEGINNLKDEILTQFEGNINKKAISILVEAQTYNRDYFIDKKSMPTRSRIIMKKDNTVKIDDLDLEILKSLSKNARKSIVEIASELNQTVRIINYRINQLQKNKIILGYKMAINYEKLGIKFFKIFIYLDNPEKEQTQALIRYLEQNKNMICFGKVLGSWDLEAEFEVYSIEEFNKIINDLKDNYSNIIKNIDIITISKEHKFIYF